MITEAIPDPADSGSSGTQVKATDIGTSHAPERILVGRPLERSIVGLASTNARNMGGELAATLLAASFSHVSLELSEAKDELKKTRGEQDSIRASLESARIEIAELKGRLASLENEKAIRSVCLIAGTGVAGFGIDQVRGNQVMAGWILIGVGVVLALIGWFSIGGRGSK